MPRFITIPSPTLVPSPNGPAAYPFAMLLSEFVFSDPRWKTEWAEHFAPTYVHLHGAKVGSVVELPDDAFARIYVCAMAAQPGPAFLLALMPMIHAITIAPTTRPGFNLPAAALIAPASKAPGVNRKSRRAAKG